MPFDNPDNVVGGPVTPSISPYDQPDPKFLDTVGAAFRQENLIGSALSSARVDMATKDFMHVDPTYNVFNDIKGYEQYASRFEHVYNPKAAEAVKADIDKELKDRQTLAASGFTGVALSMAAGVLDPTILIPAGAMIRSGAVGYSALRSGASVALGAGLGVAVQEAGLQATQETRTPMESALNIGGSMILGAIVGTAGARFLSGAEWTKLSKSLEEELSGTVPNPVEVADTIVQRMQAAGSANVAQLKLEDLGVGGPKAAEVVANATAAMRINPGVETMLSPSAKVREAYAKLVDNPIYTKMNMEGRTPGAPVENLVKEYERGRVAQWMRSSRSLFREAKKAGFEGTLTDFNERVAKAARRNDADPLGNEFVTKAARDAREKILDPLKERAIKNGQLPENVKTTTAASYLHRMWNRQKLVANEMEFRKIASDYFREQIGKIPLDKRPDFVSEADIKSYIDDVVSSVFDNLTGRGNGDTPDWLVPVKRGPLKERTFNIPDHLVENFLENDMELVLRRYARTMGAEVELHEKFGRADMKDQFDAIRNDYRDLRKKAKTEAELKKLHKSELRDVKNMEAFRDMIRGTYRAAEEGSGWSQLTRAALAWNYMRLLGGVTLTSLSDASRLIGVHGIRATMRETLPSLVSNIKAIKISKADARDLGAVAEVMLQSRIATLADLNDPYRYGSAMDRYISNTTNMFSKATGLAYWNDTMKSIASVMTQNRMAKNAINWSKASAREKAYMAFLGIDEDMAQRIAKQLQDFGTEEKGIWGGNVGKWTDDRARRAWAAALNKDVDRIIVTKGVADQPLWTRTNWGRIIMQFKSFGLASHQRVLIAGLQEAPQRMAEQMVFGTAIGMMVSYLKMIERGDTERAQNLIENPGLWVADGFDRTGIASIPFDISNTIDKISAANGGPNVGFTAMASALAGDPNSQGGVSRYASRNAIGAVGGPSVGLFSDWARISAALMRGDANKGDVNAAIRQIPGATLPGIRTAIHVGIKPALQEMVQ